MTDPDYRGPGIRGLMPGPGDQVLIDHRHVPGLAHPHWFRTTKVRSLSDALELSGWLIAREELGEVGTSAPFTVLVTRPAELVVRRPVDAPVIQAGADPVPLPGLVAQLVEPTWHRPMLTPAVEEALAHPERHEGRSDLPRSEGSGPPHTWGLAPSPRTDQSRPLQCAYLRSGAAEMGGWR
jgi:hypothetical protein